MTDLPSMPLYVDDFEAATAHLTIEEDGAYNRLLRLCWRTSGCSIPDDDEWIRRRVRVSQQDYERLFLPIIDEFFIRSRGRVYQKRQREIFEEVSGRVQKRKQAGKKGGLAKAAKTKENHSSNATDLPVAKRKQNSTVALASKTKTKTKTKEPPNPQGGSDLFGENSKPQKATPVQILSDVLPPEVAQDLVDHRKQIKKPISELAAKKMVNELRRFRDPIASVNKSIVNGWQGVFDTDPASNGAPSIGSDGLSAVQRRVRERARAN